MEEQIRLLNKRLKIVTVTLLLIPVVVTSGSTVLYLNLNVRYESLQKNQFSLSARYEYA